MNKEQQIKKEYRDLYNKLSWLNSQKMKDRFEDYKPSEVHCIEYIGRNEDINVTKLAASFYMTRGAISKITKKLMQKGAVESYQKPDNKKEIYFRLTKQGEAINRTHEALHQEFEERDRAVFQQVTEEQFDVLLHFVERYNHHLDGEMEKQGLEPVQE